MSIKNIKYYLSPVASQHNVLGLTALQFLSNSASDPTDSDLAEGRLHYKTGVGLRVYSGSAWITLGSGSGGITSWDGLYALDTSMTIDGASMTFAGTHATNDVFTITNATGSGDCLQITNSGSGNDVSGTSAAWTISAAGAAKLTSITGIASITAATNLTIDATGAGTITLAGTSTGAITLTRAVTATASITITGTADTTVLTVTNGDMTIGGSITITENDTTTYGLNITSSGTSGGGFKVTADDLTSGAAIYVDSDNEASFSGDGGYLNLTNNGTSVFKVQRYGALTIAGNAEGTASITCTKGDLVLTDGALVITAGAFTYTAGDMAMSDGSLAITDADNAATFSVTNNTATDASVIVLAGSGVFTGSTTTSWMTVTPSGLTSGTGMYVIGAGLTTGKLVDLATDATMTTGTILNVQCTGANDATTSGKLAAFDLTATAITSSVNKTASGIAVTSSRTTTSGTVADDWDLVSMIRTDIINGAGSMSATGAVLYIENAVTNTSGTVTDTTKGLEIVMDSLGTGAGVNVTHAATGGVAINVVGASTSVDDVLITGSGAHTSNLATLQVTNSGNTAAAGSILRIAQSGTPTATSYLAEFTNEHATVSSNPMCVRINAHTSTNTALSVTSAGAASGLGVAGPTHFDVECTNAGAAGSIMSLTTAGGSQTTNDYIGTILFIGQDDAGTPAVNTYGGIFCQANAAVAGSEDGRLELHVSVGGTLTELFAVESTAAGAKDCEIKTATLTLDGVAKATTALTVTAGDAVLTSGHLTLTDGNITLTANSSTITCTGTGTNGMLLTNLYNDTASALSGTQKDIKIMIGATPYYFTVYPTKA